MNMHTSSFRGVAMLTLLALVLAACGAKDKPAEPVRPVQLTQVKLGGTQATAVQNEPCSPSSNVRGGRARLHYLPKRDAGTHHCDRALE